MTPGHIDFIDDDESLRETILELLSAAGHSVTVWRDAYSFLAAWTPRTPAVILTDMRMPDLSGLDLHRELQLKGCQTPVVYISAESTPRQTIQAMKLGAEDFLLKPFGRQELLDAVAQALEKDQHRVEHLRFKQAQARSLAELSPRELEVLRLWTRGYNNAEIVEELGIALPTAKQYKSQIKHKLQLNALSDLIRFTQGVFDDPPPSP